jgi:hypothetical protein
MDCIAILFTTNKSWFLFGQITSRTRSARQKQMVFPGDGEKVASTRLCIRAVGESNAALLSPGSCATGHGGLAQLPDRVRRALGGADPDARKLLLAVQLSRSRRTPAGSLRINSSSRMRRCSRTVGSCSARSPTARARELAREGRSLKARPAERDAVLKRGC